MNRAQKNCGRKLCFVAGLSTFPVLSSTVLTLLIHAGDLTLGSALWQTPPFLTFHQIHFMLTLASLHPAAPVPRFSKETSCLTGSEIALWHMNDTHCEPIFVTCLWGTRSPL